MKSVFTQTAKKGEFNENLSKIAVNSSQVAIKYPKHGNLFNLSQFWIPQVRIDLETHYY